MTAHTSVRHSSTHASATARWPLARSTFLALALGLLGCTGAIADNGGTSSSGGGSGGGVGGSSNVPLVPGDPGLGLMHRLNTAEYNATVSDVLGTTLQPANDNWRGGEVDGFDNIASVLGMDDTQYGLYVDAAEAIAEDVFASDALRAKVVTCAATDDQACVKRIIAGIGLKLFRRPLSDAEVGIYQQVYTTARQQGEDHNGSVKNVLWSLLSSVDFLYRMEFDNGATSKHPITGYELASRLSYFLWSSAPDDALLASAERLNTDQAISAAVDRMLQDPKSARFVNNFVGQWLGARKVLNHAVAADIYPDWSPDVAQAATTEMYQYFDEFLRKDRPWSEFLKADFNFVNAPLGRLYGMSNVSGTQMERVQDTTDQRAGFLGLAGFLTVSSLDRRSSPTIRGKWMLVNLLCTLPPPPPANVPKLEEQPKDPATNNVRAILEAHRADPACAACHATIDPFGLALEQFDGIGKFRTKYPDGSLIDPSTQLGDTKFSGLSGAADALTDNAMFKQCIAQKAYTYALGRSVNDEDSKNVALIAQNWDKGGPLTISRLLHGLATAEAFRVRDPAAAP